MIKSKALSLLLLAFVAVAFSFAANAAEKGDPPGITATFYKCVEKTYSDAVAAGACLTAEQHYQDKRLNIAYKKLLDALGEKDRPYLVAAERAWINLKDKDGALETVIYGDEQIDNLQQSQNEVFRICERANSLELYLNLVRNK